MAFRFPPHIALIFQIALIFLVISGIYFFFLSKNAPQPPAAKKTPQRKPCSLRMAKYLNAQLEKIAQEEEGRRWKDNTLESKQAAWLYAKAQYAISKVNIQNEKALDASKRFFLEDTYFLLRKSCDESRHGVQKITEEKGARLRAYLSETDHSYQTYSLSVPDSYNPAIPTPLIISMHGHGWHRPFQGHPAPKYAGAFCLSPQGRGATDYKDIGELDVLAALEEVRKEFNIDPDRIYLTGGSMGGTGTYQLASHYTDLFAGALPIVGNADNEAWTKAWGWNRKFPGRNDALRQWIQDGHTARAYVQNMLTLPMYIIAGSGDTVVPPDHSRNIVNALRTYHANVEYREYPHYGHGGFPSNSVADALAWVCSWKRNPAPKAIYWKADQLRYGKAYWTRMEQFEAPLTSAYLYTTFVGTTLNFQTKNLLAFSFQRPRELFSNASELTLQVDGQPVHLTLLPDSPEQWVTLRKSPIHGWCDQRDIPAPELYKRRGLEGPVNEVLNAPFMLVVGTSSPDEEMNNAWKREAETFCAEWKRRNGVLPVIKTDKECTIEDMQSRHIILFGSERDNITSELVSKFMPIADIMSNLPLRNADPLEGNNPLNAPDLGSIILYPNIEYAPDKLIVLLSANSPESAFQLWGRFGNWFNWGVFDCKKYFDYLCFDARSASPETDLLLGWYGTDWKVESGKYFLGNEELRSKVAPMGYPPFDKAPDTETLLLAELMPSTISQMRGAVGFGRGFFGEDLETPGSLGMRAPCSMTFDINGKFSTFATDVTLLNSPETNMCLAREKGEAVKFVVSGDGRKLKEVTVRWNAPKAHLKIDVTHVRTLQLDAVTAGGPSWLHSGCAWLGPTLWRNPPPNISQTASSPKEK